MAIITLAGESLIAQKQAGRELLDVVRFIYANVPGLDPQAEIDRAALKPPADQIVYTHEIPATSAGYVNPNQVVYSSMLNSSIGDFDWNWLGLETAEGVLFAVAYVPLQQKRRYIPPHQIGNNTTRNILVEYSGAKELTGIMIDASTWQHDFTVRLAGIDERERQSNRDIFGRACFIGEAFAFTQVGAQLGVKPGLAYIEGIRVNAEDIVSVNAGALPSKLWLDVCLQGQLNDRVASFSVFQDPADRADYVDSTGEQHYVVLLHDVPTLDTVVDMRTVVPAEGPLVHHFATVKAVNAVRDKVVELVDGTTPAGKAKALATARTFAFEGAATGQVSFNGTQDVSVDLTLTGFDWSKVISGKPTTLAGYGITDAIKRGSVGLAGTLAPIGHVDTLGLDGGFYSWVSGDTSLVNYCSVINVPYASGKHFAQLALAQGGPIARLYARSTHDEGGWTPTVELYHTGNLKPESIVPAGTLIQTFARTAPVGTLRCNGAAVSRTTFAALFAAIGTYYGAGDGVTTFNLPDTRGLFIRDVDESRGFDLGRTPGTLQLSQNLSHSHSTSTSVAGSHIHAGSNTSVAGSHTHAFHYLNTPTTQDIPGTGSAMHYAGVDLVANNRIQAAGDHSHTLNIASDGAHAHTVTVDPSGGAEARPVNMALYYFIKY
ncbi:phage tail protein [Mitsuaria sp. RG]|nr:phage tail protein [Mitsuaria sp. RG]